MPKISRNRNPMTVSVTLATSPPTLKDGRKLIGESDKWLKTIETCLRVAEYDQTHVLLWGETGTGKELLARLIHDNSPRSGAAFVPLHCGALARDLVESDLFGHVRGAFTGAEKDSPGAFVNADGGTLFLDEVGELPPETQVKLLRAVEGHVRPVGGNAEKKVNVRIISATHRSIHDMVDGHVENRPFREDLMRRIVRYLIRLPPLREREGDIILLAQAGLDTLSQRYAKPKVFLDGAKSKLTMHTWPGNVRELEQVVEQAYVDCKTTEIHADDIRWIESRRQNAATTRGVVQIPNKNQLALQLIALHDSLGGAVQSKQPKRQLRAIVEGIRGDNNMITLEFVSFFKRVLASVAKVGNKPHPEGTLLITLAKLVPIDAALVTKLGISGEEAERVVGQWTVWAKRTESSRVGWTSEERQAVSAALMAADDVVPVVAPPLVTTAVAPA